MKHDECDLQAESCIQSHKYTVYIPIDMCIYLYIYQQLLFPCTLNFSIETQLGELCQVFSIDGRLIRFLSDIPPYMYTSFQSLGIDQRIIIFKKGKTTCRLRRMTANAYDNYLCLTAGVIFLSLGAGQTLPRSNFMVSFYEDNMLSYLERPWRQTMLVGQQAGSHR